MSKFTDEEVAYLQGQRLGRLATVDAKGDLHVVPVGFRHAPAHATSTSAATTSPRPGSTAMRRATGAWPSWSTTPCRPGSRASSRCEGGFGPNRLAARRSE